MSRAIVVNRHSVMGKEARCIDGQLYLLKSNVRRFTNDNTGIVTVHRIPEQLSPDDLVS